MCKEQDAMKKIEEFNLEVLNHRKKLWGLFCMVAGFVKNNKLESATVYIQGEGKITFSKCELYPINENPENLYKNTTMMKIVGVEETITFVNPSNFIGFGIPLHAYENSDIVKKDIPAYLENK